MTTHPATLAAWAQRRDRSLPLPVGHSRLPSRRRLCLSPEALAWAKREVFAHGATVEATARRLNVPRTTLQWALVRPEYGVGRYPVGTAHPSTRHPDEVVETIRWLATLPECPRVGQIARVFRVSRDSVYLYLNGSRRRQLST